MSTSLLYHGFGLRGSRYVRQEFRAGQMIFHIEQPRERLRCPPWRSDDVWAQGGVERTLRTVPIGPKPVLLQFQAPRGLCFECDKVRQVQLGFADPTKHSPRACARYVLELSRHVTIQDVAQHRPVSWDTVKDIQARSLQRRFGKPKLPQLKQIAIDEIAIGTRPPYRSVVRNLVSGAVVFVGDGQGAQALTPFWRRLRRARAQIAAVATATSAAYVRAVRDTLPRAVHVFDHFHVIKLFNAKLSAFRRELDHQRSGAHDRTIRQGPRWLLLKNPENRDPQRNELQRLEEALRRNAPLATAYYLKEDLRQIRMQSDKRTARRVLRAWRARARASEVRMRAQFADTGESYQEGILAYYDYPISTGPLEGTTTKIPVLKRQAYGCRDRAFFKLRAPKTTLYLRALG